MKGVLQVWGSEITTLPDGTTLGIVMISPRREGATPSAHLSIADPTGEETLVWVDEGSVVDTVEGQCIVTSISERGPDQSVTMTWEAGGLGATP